MDGILNCVHIQMNGRPVVFYCGVFKCDVEGCFTKWLFHPQFPDQVGILKCCSRNVCRDRRLIFQWNPTDHPA